MGGGEQGIYALFGTINLVKKKKIELVNIGQN